MDPSDDRVPAPPMSGAVWRLTRKVLPQRLGSLLRALELAPIEGWGFGAPDVARVEAYWELLEDDSTAHGFVLALRDGRRLYLQYIVAYEGDNVDEDVQTLPMHDERYPAIEGGGIVWDDDVEDLTKLLAEEGGTCPSCHPGTRT
jgi:hypothetical protein